MEIAENPSVNVDFGSRRNSKEGTLLFDEKITKNGLLDGDGRIHRRPRRGASKWTSYDCTKEGFSGRNRRGNKSNCTEDEKDAGKNQKLMIPGDRNMTNGDVHKDVEGAASPDNTLNGGVTFISDDITCKFNQNVKISSIRAVIRGKRKHSSREPHCSGNGIDAEESKEDSLRTTVNGMKRSNYCESPIFNNRADIDSKGESITESSCGLEVPTIRSNVTRLKRKRKDVAGNGDCLLNGTCVKIETIRDKQKPNQEGAHPIRKNCPNKGNCHGISTLVEEVGKTENAGDRTAFVSGKETLPNNSCPNISRTKDDNSNGIPNRKSTVKNSVNTNPTNFKPVRLKRKRLTRNLGPNDNEPRNVNHDHTTDKEDVNAIPCYQTSSVPHKNITAHKATTNNDIKLTNDETESNECDTFVNKLEICNSKDAGAVKINGRKHRLNRATVINGTKFSDVCIKIFNKKGTINDTCGTAVKENGSTVDKHIEPSKIWSASSSCTTISYTKEGALHCGDESRVSNKKEAEVKRNGPSSDPCGTSSNISDIGGNHKVSVDKFKKGSSAEVDVTSQCYCKWINCHEKLKDPLELKQHVKELHVKGMVGSDLFFCFWKGCKVYNKPSSSYRWLVKHVNFHVGVRPFQCVIEPCQLSFASQNALIRHVQSHFNHRSKYYKKPDDVSKEANVTPGKDEEVNSGSESSGGKEMKNRRLQLFMRRRRPVTSCQNDDPLDRSSIDYIKKKLLGLEKDPLDTCKPTETNFWRNGQVLGKRTAISGKIQYLVEHPSPSRGHGTWLDETVVQNNDSKQVSILQLSREKKDELCNKVFGYSKRPRGRKRR